LISFYCVKLLRVTENDIVDIVVYGWFLDGVYKIVEVRRSNESHMIVVPKLFYMHSVKYTVKTNFISTCEISEKARNGKISFAETEKIFFSYNPHENFPAKKMNKYFLHMKKYFFIFFAGKFSCGLWEKKIFFPFQQKKCGCFCRDVPFRYFT
jgi:hypothetical protein